MTFKNLCKCVYRYMTKNTTRVQITNFIGTPSEKFMVVDSGIKRLVVITCNFIDQNNWDTEGDVLVVFYKCTFKNCNKPLADNFLHLA